MWTLRSLYVVLSVSANLVFLAEVTRHGARAPSKLWEFNEEYWDKDKLKMLTEVGMKQHFELGRQMRERYPSIFARYDETEFDLLTSPSSRAVMSAYAHVAGLYPDGPEWLQKFDGSGDPNTLHSVLPEFPADSPIKIAKEKEQLHAIRGHDPEVCPRIKEIKKEMSSSEEYKAKENLWSKIDFHTISEALGFTVSTISEVNSLKSAIDCEEHAGRKNPDISDEIKAIMNAMRVFQMNHVPYYSLEAQSLVSCGFFTRLISQVEAALQGSGLKYAYYSTHDYPLVSYLRSLGIKNPLTPGFAASLVFEVYDDLTVRILYNQKLLEFESFNGECSWPDLKKIMENHCKIDITKDCEPKKGDFSAL